MPDNFNPTGQPAQEPGNSHAALNIMTEITSTRPAVVGKTYDLNEDGEIIKNQIAHITQGTAVSFEPHDVNDFCRALERVANSRNIVLTPSLWHGDTDGSRFDIVSEAELARLTGHAVGAPELAGILDIDGRRVAARLKRGLDQTPYMLGDWDDAPGIPPALAAMDAAARVHFMSAIIPGFDTCERVDLYGSSARIIGPGRPDRGPTHSWFRVSHPQNMDAFKAHIRVNMVLAGLSFRSPRYSRREPGTIIGHAHRTVMDTATLDAGRVVFCSIPEISQAMKDAGYSVRTDPGITVINRGGGVLDISGYTLPDAQTLERYSGATGERITFTRESGNIATHSRGVLTLQSEIEVRGTVDTLENWLATMPDGGQLRCEAPTRDSNSEAAFIRKMGNGLGFVHDIGNSTTYHLDVDAIRNADVAELATVMAPHMPPGAVAAAVDASDAREAVGVMNSATDEARGDLVTVMHVPALPHLTIDGLILNLPILDPPVFRRGGGLVYPDTSHEIRIFDERGVSKKVPTLGLTGVQAGWLKIQFCRKVALMSVRRPRAVDGSLGNARPVQVPLTTGLVAELMLQALPTVPTISGIISTPTMRPDGSLLTENGFDDATGFWLDHDLTVSVPETPTGDEALAAYNTLLELLDGFPMDNMSKSVVIAHMMGAVLRPAFPTMPALMIEAPAAGSGKSYLTKVIGLLTHGKIPAVSNWPKGEEFTKHLHSMMVAGVSFIAYDNANGVEVGGQELCTLLTEPEMRIRMLGETRHVTVPTAGVVLTVNGNHPTLKEDVTERFITCYINPDTARPRERTFDNDPLELLTRDRGRYVAACLTIARAYLADRSPGALSYGSFERWSLLVRSALIWLVGDDVIATTREAVADDPDLQRLVSLLGMIVGAVGFTPDPTLTVRSPGFKVNELLAAIQERDPMQLQTFGSLVGAVAAGATIPSEASIKQKAGQYFHSKARDRVTTIDHAGEHMDVRLTKGTPDRTGARWKLVKVRTIGPTPEDE